MLSGNMASMRFSSAMQLRKASGVGCRSLASDWLMRACMVGCWAWILAVAIVKRMMADKRFLMVDLKV